MLEKTIRLVIPDWQAGDNPVYELGAKVLKAIAPENKNQKTITVKTVHSTKPQKMENGVRGQSSILKNLKNTKEVILKEKPDSIITFGGNCLVSQQPISYLNGIYGEKMGVIWIDAHPDISTPDVYYNEHAMVVGNLLHCGDSVIQKEVNHPLKPNQIYYAGLQEVTPAEKDLLSQAGVEYKIEESHELDPAEVRKWIKKNNFEYLYIHLDVDVMDPSPSVFYATYFNNPELKKIPENAVRGKIEREAIWRYIGDLSNEFDLAGFTIAEYLPWSAKQMLDLMKMTSIF